MGGNLKIHSEGTGKGTTVTAQLPSTLVESKAWDVVLFPGQAVVIIDDDPSIHRFFEKKLTPHKEVVIQK